MPYIGIGFRHLLILININPTSSDTVLLPAIGLPAVGMFILCGALFIGGIDYLYSTLIFIRIFLKYCIIQREEEVFSYPLMKIARM